MVFFAH
jgi:hypothetical protein